MRLFVIKCETKGGLTLYGQRAPAGSALPIYWTRNRWDAHPYTMQDAGEVVAALRRRGDRPRLLEITGAAVASHFATRRAS